MFRYLRALWYLETSLSRTRWTESRLTEYRNRKLRKVIKYAYDNIPFYHRKMREQGIMPTDIRTVEDLKRLPIIRKSEMRNDSEALVSKEFTVSDLRSVWTSGSTGRPLSVVLTTAEDDFRKVRHIRANALCGHRARDSWVTVTSPTNFGGATKFQRKIGIFAPSFISIFENTATQVSMIERLHPDVLEGYSSSLTLIAREIARRGNNSIAPRMMFGGAEMIHDSSRRLLEQTFGAPFYDQYASIELGRMAWQCRKRQGYHIDSDALVMEFVDEEGNEVSKGESGEIVCTSLFSYAMPFIRYAMGDRGTPAKDYCSCGMSFPLMQSIEGRSDSFLLLPNGEILSPVCLLVVVRMSGIEQFIEQYQVVQRRIDRFEIRIQPRSGISDLDMIETRLLSQLKKMLHLTDSQVTFTVNFIEHIPLDRTGKLRAIISESQANYEQENNV
jgi:phenylacetate-CoA ligase